MNDVITTNENTPVQYNVTSNDYDVDGTVIASTVDLDPGTAGIQNTFTNVFGNWDVNASGVVTYAPATNYYGNATVNYTVQDNDGNTSNIGTFLVTVNFVNQPPVAVNDTISTSENTPVSINVTTNDHDADGTINVATVDLDSSSPGIQTSYTVAGQGTYTVDTTGVVTFTSELNYYGVATPINYTVKDNLGALSNNATLTVTVKQVILPPLAENDSAITHQYIPVSLNVTTNDISLGSTINLATVDLDPLTAGIQHSYVALGEGTYTVDNTGLLTFTSDSVFYGTTTPIYYTVNDNLGQTSNKATITITVIAAKAPVAVNDSATTTENTPVTFNITNNDYGVANAIN